MSRNLRGPHIRNKRKDPEIKIKVEQVLDKAKLNERERERERERESSPASKHRDWPIHIHLIKTTHETLMHKFFKNQSCQT